MTNLSQRIVTGLGKRLRSSFSQRLLFLHIPKCGGTSIVHAMGACYGPRSMDPSQFYLDAAAVFETARLFDQHFQQISEKLLLYAMAQKQCRFITGHFFFSEKAHSRFGDQWQTVTVLRDPVARWFSQYYFNRYKHERHYKTDADLEAYIDSQEGIGAGRTLLNVLEGSGRDWGGDPQQGVRRATANLEKISLVGILENLEQFKTRFRERYGTNLKIGTLRKSPVSGDQVRARVSGAILEKVRHICRYDSQIYQHALRIASTNGL